MRRISRITVAGAATASLALALSACGGTSTSASSDSKGGDKGLAIAYDVGGKGDQSFNDAAYAGLEQAKKEFGYKTADVEPTEGETDADKEQRLVSLSPLPLSLLVPPQAVAASASDATPTATRVSLEIRRILKFPIFSKAPQPGAQFGAH